MARTVAIGHQDFEVIRKNEYFYIDKTDFIREWWERGDSVTLITRPRRFGKTLNMSMTEKFFSVKYANRADLFEGLTIWQEEKYRELQGTYPVIFLSFAGVKESTFGQARKQICQLITELYHENTFLLSGDCLNEREKAEYCEVSADMEEYRAAMSLKSLSNYLSRYYGKRVILLLDEYDTPMQEAFIHGYWEELAAFIRPLLNAAFKTNPSLERAIMTGITRVSRESIFSDLNNMKVVSASSKEYAQSFGFTEQEVCRALDEYGLSDKKDEVRHWYDGFVFGTLRDIYNPWSVTNYLDTGVLEAYWANTSSNSLAGTLIREGSSEIKKDFEDLMRGSSIQKTIDEQIVFNQLYDNENAVWSLLLASGYLKIEDCICNSFTGEKIYRLSLTNWEVKVMFRTVIQEWFARREGSYHSFLKALLAADLDAMNEYMNQVAQSTFSYFDTGNSTAEGGEPERFYHGFVLGLLVDLSGRYAVTSNRESGFGRYDVMLEPLRREDDAIILEFKVFRPKTEKTLEDTIQNALNQIEEKNYAAALLEKGISRERIRQYGFGFQGKKVLIGNRI